MNSSVWRGRSLSSAAMVDSHDKDHEEIVFHAVDHAIVADVEPQRPGTALDRNDTGRTRVVSQPVDAMLES